MARYTESVCRLCRREGEKLYLKGDRCYGDKCSFYQRSYAPRQQASAARKNARNTAFSCVKKKARRIYGVLENNSVCIMTKPPEWVVLPVKISWPS